MTTYQFIAKNKRESWILIFSFLVVISLIGYVFSQYFQNPAILYIAVFFSLFSALFSYYFSDSVTLAVSKAQEVDRNANRELYNIVENLCITAGIPTPKIYIINDPAPNAFATGRDPKHAVICYTSGILARLNETELEGVTAHELSHIGNYDIRVMTLVVVLVGTLTMLANIFLRSSIFGGTSQIRYKDRSNLTLIFAIIGILLAIVSPIIAVLIKMAVSRQREYLADASGALLTRYPEGLASALEKISSDPRPLVEANNATAHLFIVNPFHQDREQTSDEQKAAHGGRSWFAGLFNTHPPIEDRVKRLREMNL
jgi:heat shock protein HtpX